MRLPWHTISCNYSPKASSLSSIENLSAIDLLGQRVLLAIGSNYLPQAVNAVRQAGATPYARVLPRSRSLANSLRSGLPETHLAVLQPTASDQEPHLEIALCRRWGISSVVCRQSGGRTQRIWEFVAKKEKIRLFLISRPSRFQDIKTITSSEALLKYIDCRLKRSIN